VAAHWRYKEGGGQDDVYLESSIALLRNMLESGERDEDLLSEFASSQKNARVYVFTPKGDVVDLTRGATPLDFAYTIHTEIGHRCRGAKINGRIVSLNTVLQDADSVEVITAKVASPTREWLNERLGYVHSNHIRAKIRSWFNKLDYQQHVDDGGHIFERELNRYSGRGISDTKYAEHFGQQSPRAMLAAIGRGLITNNQLLAAILQLNKPASVVPQQGRRRKAPKPGEIKVSGVGNLLTHCAACCQPVHGDPIIGFVTRGRGVSVHRQSCTNIQNLSIDDMPRLMPVQWSEEAGVSTEAELHLQAFDREGLLRDVSAVLSKENVHLNAINTRSDRERQTASMDLTLELKNTEQLSFIVDRLAQIPNVFQVQRRG
jgi:GTP pyrophosphokinase